MCLFLFATKFPEKQVTPQVIFPTDGQLYTWVTSPRKIVSRCNSIELKTESVPICLVWNLACQVKDTANRTMHGMMGTSLFHAMADALAHVSAASFDLGNQPSNWDFQRADWTVILSSRIGICRVRNSENLVKQRVTAHWTSCYIKTVGFKFSLSPHNAITG